MGRIIKIRKQDWRDRLNVLTDKYPLSTIKEADENYIITHDQKKHTFYPDYNTHFAEQFPIFPYSSEKYEAMKMAKYQQGLDSKFDKINQKLEELQQENIKLLSHLEAIMIAIGERSVLADNIKL
jgi:hypothetical protein